MLDYQKDIIQEFWEWIAEHKEYVDMQYHDENTLFLYIAFEKEIIKAFIGRYEYYICEGGVKAILQNNSICFDLRDIESGYGFSMKDLWDNRPAGIEDSFGYRF